MTTKDIKNIKLRNFVDVQINYGEWRRYVVTHINGAGGKIHGIALTAHQTDKIIDIIHINFEPTKIVPVNE